MVSVDLGSTNGSETVMTGMLARTFQRVHAESNNVAQDRAVQVDTSSAEADRVNAAVVREINRVWQDRFGVDFQHQ